MVAASAVLELSGGELGGDIDIITGRNIRLNGPLDARGRAAGSEGGTVTIDAGGTGSPGDLLVSSTIDVSGGGCSLTFCGQGGFADLSGCNVDVTATGSILVRGGEGGGDTVLAARRQLTIRGQIDATRISAAGADGTNTLFHPSLTPPIIGLGLVTPEPSVTACDPASCTGLCMVYCSLLCDCGDGTIDEFETCDGSASGCGLDEVCGAPRSTSQCMCISTCGNGAVDPGEDCDGQDLGGEECVSLGYTGGTLACKPDCTFDVSGCDPVTCGDGMVGPGEVCDGAQLGGVTCQSLGFIGGDLACSSDCTQFDTSACVLGACGDGVKCSDPDCTTGPGGGPEECDDGNANSNDAACLPSCRLARCGDGFVCTAASCTTGPGGGGEECDDGNANNNDTCLGTCQEALCGDSIVCSAPACTSGPGGGPEQCDETSICCLSTCSVRSCPDDGQSCNATSGCCHPDETCEDGNPCTDDVCNLFSGCSHEPVTGCCPVAQGCDDGNACTTDSCDPVDGCLNVPIPGCCQNDAECDDGDPCTDDRCNVASRQCVAEANSAPCDDGNACTTDDICSEGSCVGGPSPCTACETCHPELGCLVAPQGACFEPTEPSKVLLLIRNKDNDNKDKVAWTWLKGEKTEASDFGDPVEVDDYTLCMYANSDRSPSLLFSATAPAGGMCPGRKGGKPCWKGQGNPPGRKGYRYKDRAQTPDGLDLLLLKPGEEGKAKVVVKGKGIGLGLPPLSTISLPLMVQLRAANGKCWQAEYDASGILANRPDLFKARGTARSPSGWGTSATAFYIGSGNRLLATLPDGTVVPLDTGTGICQGGSLDGAPCVVDTDCPGGGACGDRLCAGGPNHASPCSGVSDCPSGSCGEAFDALDLCADGTGSVFLFNDDVHNDPNWDRDPQQTGTILRVGLDGSQSIVTQKVTETSPVIACDRRPGGRVYWAQYDLHGVDEDEREQLVSIPKAGGSITTHVPDISRRLGDVDPENYIDPSDGFVFYEPSTAFRVTAGGGTRYVANFFGLYRLDPNTRLITTDVDELFDLFPDGDVLATDVVEDSVESIIRVYKIDPRTLTGAVSLRDGNPCRRTTFVLTAAVAPDGVVFVNIFTTGGQNPAARIRGTLRFVPLEGGQSGEFTHFVDFELIEHLTF
jgi:hypothetical protein